MPAITQPLTSTTDAPVYPSHGPGRRLMPATLAPRQAVHALYCLDAQRLGFQGTGHYPTATSHQLGPNARRLRLKA
jgi:hypothetical protein